MYSQIIIGVGRDRNLLQVVEIALQELRKADGPPRRLIASAAGIELQAGRDTWDGEFTSCTIQITIDPAVRETIERFVQDRPACSMDSGEVQDEVRVTPGDGASPEDVRSLLQQLSELIDVPETWRVRGEGHDTARISPERLFVLMKEANASDVHLFPGSPPVLRINGDLIPVDESESLSAHQITEFTREIAPVESWNALDKEKQCSFRFFQSGQGCSRVSVFHRAGVPHCTLRFLPETIPSFELLNIPSKQMRSLANLQEGLVLVSGMTGSGKSTTVASLIDWINTNKSRHILTVEDPVEYVQTNKQSVVSQREAGLDISSFTQAVRGALRHDPDVIFVGEMRDADTILAVIDAAATGHLVLSTMHAATAADVVNRIVSFFDPVARDLVRRQLHECLRCVVCQRLIPKKTEGRVPALEFLFNDSKQISDSILAGDSRGIRIGMQQTFSESTIFEESLLKLFRAGLITETVAQSSSPHPVTFEQMELGTYAPPPFDSVT